MLPLLLCHIHNSQPPRFIFLQVLPGPIISIGTFICLHVPPRFLSFHIPIIFHTAGGKKKIKYPTKTTTPPPPPSTISTLNNPFPFTGVYNRQQKRIHKNRTTQT
jgi:hypothetical protein